MRDLVGRRPAGLEAVMGDITLYTHAVSQSSEKVRWALDAAGIPYVERLLPPFVHTQWLTSPGGGLFASMPVLEGDGETISDSTRILEWLEARRAPFPLIPRDPMVRAQVMAAESRFDMGASHLLRLVYGELLERRELALRLFGLDANLLQRLALRAAFPLIEQLFVRGLDTSAISMKRSQRIVERLVAELDRVAEAGQRFLVGDSFSVADITACALFAPLACPEEHPVYSRRDYRHQMGRVLAPWRDRPGLAWVRGMYRCRGVSVNSAPHALLHLRHPAPGAAQAS
jgi:glutathione S-transferase